MSLGYVVLFHFRRYSEVCSINIQTSRFLQQVSVATKMNLMVLYCLIKSSNKMRHVEILSKINMIFTLK